jgi:signal transduction histidine kinase
MNLQSTSRTIIAYILLFPPIALLLYAIVSYIIFLNYQQNISRDILNIEKSSVNSISKSAIKSKAITINRVLNRHKNIKEFFEDIKDIESVISINPIGAVILDRNNKLIFPKKFINTSAIQSAKIVQSDSFYEDKNIIAYAINKNRYKLKIVSFLDKSAINIKINHMKELINQKAKDSVKSSLISLLVIWSLLVALSFYVTMLIYKKLRRYKEALENTNNNIIFQSRKAMLGELLPMIAHQWRQPINKIASVLMRMRMEIAKGEPNPSVLDRQCQTIENSVELMSNTVDDFRSFYRPKENPEPTDLSIVVRKAVYFLDELLEKKKISIQQNLASVYLDIYANELLQVVINLIKNASDAVDVGGIIAVTLKDMDSFVELRVEDNGSGIPQDKLEKIFEPHESTKQGSMGLGLYMSKIIIQDHFKGTISAYNTDMGAGFLIRIPKK